MYQILIALTAALIFAKLVGIGGAAALSWFVVFLPVLFIFFIPVFIAVVGMITVGLAVVLGKVTKK